MRLKYCFCIIVGWLSLSLSYGQESDTASIISTDSVLFQKQDTSLVLPDSLLHADSASFSIDSLLLAHGKPVDTSSKDIVARKKENKSAMDARVEYKAVDSLRFNVKDRKVFLYKDAEIYYEDISLTSAYIDIDFPTNIVFASGLPDSTGKDKGLPVFSESGQEFQSRIMQYNFDTKKGLIQDVVTQDGEGYVEGTRIKKMPNNEINIQKGSYTTCPPCENKDFEFRYNKSKVIPGKRIVTGPAYLVIEGVPTPLFIPFGIFPNQSGRRSGIIIPTWGESAERGFYFENGGYYWAINDYMDLKMTGDIYTRGSWAIKPSFRYRKQYKFTGNFDFIWAVNILGEKGAADYQKDRDFSVRWLHQQDPKARPKSRFSADVNIKSSKSNYYNPTSTQDYLSNTFQSSVSYQTSFAEKYFLTVNANHSQSTLDKMVNLTLPEINFSVNRFYPLRKKKRVGKLKWYENISVSYNINAKNSVTTPDSLLFKPGVFDEMKNGIMHSVPISSPIKVFKYLTWTNSVNIKDRMYFQYIDRYWVDDTLFQNNDTIVGFAKTDTIRQFKNETDFSFSSSLSTKVYGMLNFGRNFPIQAIRHVLTPSVGFSYTPDFGDEKWGYYKTYYDPKLDKEVKYSVFEGGVYGSPPGAKSSSLNLSLANNLEMKVRWLKDTVTGTKKITLIDNFTIGASYDMAKDSLKWSNISMSGRTRLYKGIDITYSSAWDLYAVDSNGINVNKYEWDVNRRLLRLKNTSWNIGASFRMDPDFFKSEAEKKKDAKKTSANATQDQVDYINRNPDDYIDWEIPWGLSINYNLRWVMTHRMVNGSIMEDEQLVQTLGMSADVNITPKWKIAIMTGWDFDASDLSYTSVNIYRDLHCFEMRFNWIPIGPRKSWNFGLNVKASILQDMKLTKKKDFRDL